MKFMHQMPKKKKTDAAKGLVRIFCPLRGELYQGCFRPHIGGLPVTKRLEATALHSYFIFWKVGNYSMFLFSPGVYECIRQLQCHVTHGVLKRMAWNLVWTFVQAYWLDNRQLLNFIMLCIACQWLFDATHTRTSMKSIFFFPWNKYSQKKKKNCTTLRA